MIDYFRTLTSVTSKLGAVTSTNTSKLGAVTSTKTTLYQLIGAISDAVKPGEENLIPAIVMNLIESGKIRKLNS